MNVNKVMQLFQSDETRNLEQVARRASEFANSDNHKEAARFRRLTKVVMIKNDAALERRINRYFALAALAGIALVMLMVKAGLLD